MKSVAELNQLKEKAKAALNVKNGKAIDYKVVVGMATCGMAAGATPILKVLSDEVEKRALNNVTVIQTGCIGICQYEPVVEVVAKDGSKTTYVNMTTEKALEIIETHLANGEVVEKYTIGASSN